MSRVCLNPTCEAELGHLRSDALYCNGSCRRNAMRFGGQAAVELVHNTETFWRGYRAVRRSNQFRTEALSRLGEAA